MQKQEFIGFILFLKDKLDSGKTPRCCKQEYEQLALEIFEIIKNGSDGEQIYRKLGTHTSVCEYVYKEIYFREDCLEYLLSLGVDKPTAQKNQRSDKKRHFLHRFVR